jgi:serine/threonine protein kinase
MTPPAADDPNAPDHALGRREGEPMADWVARLREDMQARTRIGPVPRVEEYLRSFPDLADDDEAILELISMERLLRHEAGEVLTTGFFADRFPDLREEIEQQFAFDFALDEQAAEDAPPDDDLLDEIAPMDRGPAVPTGPRLPDRYVPIRWLGQGGFGDVWLCRDMGLGGRPVAIKMLRPDVVSGRASDRFRREAVMAAQVNHANICAIYDTGLDRDPPYLVFAYVDGETLREILNAGGPMEIDEAVRIARDVADGCQACHTKGIVHRDLKPENIKRDRQGWVKILDFGLARPFDPDKDRITTRGRIVGTVDYMSPEQTQDGPVPVAPPSDQFSLGAILYEMLTGRPPFSVQGQTNRVATLVRINECRPKSPRKSRPEINAALESIVLRMLRRDPKERFDSMREVVATLDSYREGNRIPVRWPQPRWWTHPAAIVVVVLVLLAGTIGVGRFLRPTSPASSTGSQATHGIVSSADLMALIRDDLDSQVKSGDRPFQRYFTLTNLANAPDVSPRVLQRHRDALTQLLTSLSVGASTAPKPIDAEKTVLRVDTSALGWTDEAFRRDIHRHNPYALQFPTDSTAEPLRDVAQDVERRLGEVDGHFPAHVRADWFIATFSDPERARALLGLSKASPEEIEVRVNQIAALRLEWADLLALYNRPVDLAAASRELGMADEQAVHEAILQLPHWGDDLFGLKPLTEGKTVPRAVWAFSDVPYTTFGQVCQQLKLGRRLLVR